MKQITVSYKKGRKTNNQVASIRKACESGAYRSLVFHIYSGILDNDFLCRIVSDLRKIFPEAIIAGTISAGEIANGQLLDKGILLSALLFAETDVTFLSYDNIKGNESSVGKNICADISKIADAKAAELLLTGTEFNTRLIFNELSRLPASVKVFGGYAGGHDMNNGEHYILILPTAKKASKP